MATELSPSTRQSANALRRFIAVPLTLLVLTSCEVGPSYKPQKADVPSSFRELPFPATQPSQITASPADLQQWWTSFNDPKLSSLIARGLQSNLDLQRAQSRIIQSRFQLGIVSAPLFPNLDATAGYQRARGSRNINIPLGGTSGGSGGGAAAGGAGTAPLAGQPRLQPAETSSASSVPPGGPQSPFGNGGFPGVETTVYQAGLDASWEVDLFGGTRRNLEAASADLQAAQEEQRDIRISMIGEIARTYVQLRGYQQQASIARDNVNAQRDTLSIIQDKQRVGLANDLDVSRQKAELASTEAHLPVLEAQVRQSIHALSILLNEEPGALSQELQTAAPLPPTPPLVPAGLPSELLRRRPDIRRAERQLAAATARIGAAQSDLYPKFSITGQMGFDSSHFENLFHWGSRYFLLSPGIDWPIFDAGRIQNNIALQRELARQSQLAYRQTILQALKEVEDSISNYRQEQLHHRSLEEAVTANQDSVKLAKDQYKNGVADFLIVLDAQRSLFDAQDTLSQSDETIAADLVTLYKSLGGGWQP